MSDTPDASVLLEAAEALIKAELLRALPEERRYEARLVAAAMAIARREIAAGGAPAEAERARLKALLGEDGDLANLRQRLAAAIRAGQFDAPGEAAEQVRAHLLATARDQLAVANPKHLRARGR